MLPVPGRTRLRICLLVNLVGLCRPRARLAPALQCMLLPPLLFRRSPAPGLLASGLVS